MSRHYRVRAVFGILTASSNGFRNGMWYVAEAVNERLLKVYVPHTGATPMIRYVGMDGGGGAHLQRGDGETDGHFEIVESYKSGPSYGYVEVNHVD